MKRRIRKVISIVLSAVLFAASAGYAPPVPAAVEMTADYEQQKNDVFLTGQSVGAVSEKGVFIGTPCEAGAPIGAASNAGPSISTPSEIPLSIGTPSEAACFEASFGFKRIKPENVPCWYRKAGKFYTFKDREGQTQFRTYGRTGDEKEPEWFLADNTGNPVEDGPERIDLEWEDLNLAPYRYESALAAKENFKELSEQLFGDETEIFNYEREIVQSTAFGRNYDGTRYDVWHFYTSSSDAENSGFYFMYGSVENSLEKESCRKKWYGVDETGRIGQVLTRVFSFLPYLPRSTFAKMGVCLQTRSGQSYKSSDFYKEWQDNFGSANKSYSLFSNDIEAKENDLFIFFVRWEGENHGGDSDPGGAERLYAPDGTLVYNSTRGSSAYGAYVMIYAEGACNGTWTMVQDPYYHYSESDVGHEGWVYRSGSTNTLAISGLHTHAYNAFSSYVTAPTCTAGGTAVYQCSCGATENRSVSALGHSWGRNYTRVEAACTSTGTASRKCSRCSRIEDVGSIPALGHAWGGNYTRVEAACTAAGNTAHKCGRCNTAADVGSIPALGHAWGGNYARVEAACTSTGTTAHKCSRCSCIEDVGSIPALGHSWPGSYITTANNGTHYKDCSRCSTRLETKYNPYTVAYNGNGNTGGSTARSSHTYHTAKALTANGFTKQHHTFDGWNARADGTGAGYGNGQSVNNLTPVYNGTMELYAKWKRSSSQVAYKDWNGSTLKTQEVSLGGTADPPENPSRTGYTFTGWDKASNNIWDHTAITAGYSINSYKLNLNGNGGTIGGTIGGSSGREHTVVYDGSFDNALKDGRNGAEREGYAFDGWHTMPLGGSRYSDSGNRMPASNVTAYAHWKPNAYLVRFDSSHVRWPGGLFEERRVFDTALGTLPSPSIYGWSLSGWKTEKNGAGEAITEHSMVEPRDATYYGDWEPGAYRIQYRSEADQPSGQSSQAFPAVQTYDQKLGELPKPEEAGYTFTGWYDGERRITPETVFCPAFNAEGFTYRAGWKANAYQVRLLGNHYGCAPVISAFDKVYFTKLGELPRPEAPGYTFKGWFDKAGAEVTGESWVEPYDADYQAAWEANAYTLHFDKNLYAIEENPQDKEAIYDEALGELPILSTAGYAFNGWHTQKEGGEQVAETTEVPLGGAIYYAHWTNNAYLLKLATENAVSPAREKAVVYDKPVGGLIQPELEDFSFRGWYLSPYSEKRREGILMDCATPSEAGKVVEDTIYRTASSSTAYAYFDLVFQEEEGSRNRRGGKDGALGTEDDNFYFNGADRIPGTSDDDKINPGKDGLFETEDDYYFYNGFPVYPGPDCIFGTMDDCMDLKDGTNQRPGESEAWNDQTNFPAHNGFDGKPGTADDWIWDREELGATRSPGPDGIFHTPDDEACWIGEDGKPGTGDEERINPGADRIIPSDDDFIDNEDGTNHRPGPDRAWGTEDDELWWNGQDGIPGNEDDELIHKGMDGAYGTMDDFIDNEDGTNHRSGPDGAWGTEDDELWWNGQDGIPGNEDDELIHKGMDGAYGTMDDFIDNEDGTNRRPGPDGIWGTKDDERWSNGPDGIPGNEDDIRMQRNSGKERTASSQSTGTWLYNEEEKAWKYHYNTGLASSGWAYLTYQKSNDWYHFDAAGRMQTGWLQDQDGRWYYLHPVSDGTQGHMYTGWKQINGKWYYFNEAEKLKGYLYTDNRTPDGFSVDQIGVWIQ